MDDIIEKPVTDQSPAAEQEEMEENVESIKNVENMNKITNHDEIDEYFDLSSLSEHSSTADNPGYKKKKTRNVGDRVKGSQEDRIRPGHIELCLSGKIPVGPLIPWCGNGKGGLSEAGRKGK
ncbi:hypothetical protein TNCT_92811 [Trichonephila clavata]|uniref:Uncharacterized protein n=1 Tax=Trichonephila clavata TaxID=2740835 RepID=A0A8X6GCW3_TRICU|nr:hypothetical protein TNCT_92811 [Trichonephila clavata]